MGPHPAGAFQQPGIKHPQPPSAPSGTVHNSTLEVALRFRKRRPYPWRHKRNRAREIVPAGVWEYITVNLVQTLRTVGLASTQALLQGKHTRRDEAQAHEDNPGWQFLGIKPQLRSEALPTEQVPSTEQVPLTDQD